MGWMLESCYSISNPVGKRTREEYVATPGVLDRKSCALHMMIDEMKGQRDLMVMKVELRQISRAAITPRYLINSPPLFS